MNSNMQDLYDEPDEGWWEAMEQNVPPECCQPYLPDPYDGDLDEAGAIMRPTEIASEEEEEAMNRFMGASEDEMTDCDGGEGRPPTALDCITDDPVSYLMEHGIRPSLEALDPDNPQNHWLEVKGGKGRVLCPQLADYIRRHGWYLIVSDGARGLREWYVYSSGVYVLQSEESFKGIIKSLIPREYYVGRDVEEVWRDLCTDLPPTERYTDEHFPEGRTFDARDHFADISELNADEDIINFANGVYCISRDKLVGHHPHYLSTIQIPCNYRRLNDAPVGKTFNRFINYHLGGDRQQIRLVMEFMGVAISNINASRMKKALFVIGEGNTGKSQLKNLLTRLLGERNCAPIGLDELQQRFGTAALYQKRLAGCSDLSALRVEEMTNFKKLTGGDVISAEFKGKPHFNFQFKGVLWFCANEFPRFGGDKGSWVYDRICVVRPTGVACTPGESGENPDKVVRDPYLLDKLWGERHYIISLAVYALRGLVERGYQYTISDKNRALLDEYRCTNSSVLTFYQECCVPRGDGGYDDCTRPALYRVYAEWCRQNSRHGYRETKSEFHKALESIGAGELVKVRGNYMYKGFTLADDVKKEYAYAFQHEGTISTIF